MVKCSGHIVTILNDMTLQFGHFSTNVTALFPALSMDICSLANIKTGIHLEQVHGRDILENLKLAF